ncbi:MAG: bifunctional UDP-N-acetylmuramoyl-tripeptide:D-alanyl-D-alanine ligase/alanine racemase [Bacteroidales bacterium]
MKSGIELSVKDICQITKGNLICSEKEELLIRDILVDSRKLIQAEGTAFFALIGSRNDGHKYISELYSRGVRCFVISRNIPNFKEMPKAQFIHVKNTLQALQTLCAYHRKQFDFPIIGITGSNGKTIIKEWLYQLLHKDHHIVRSPKSYNSQIGVPLSVWQINKENTLGIFEAGISEPDEMDRLEAILKPNIGIFTNIGQAHDKNFINTAQKIGEKLKLFRSAEIFIFCSDYSEIMAKVIGTEIFKKMKVFSWGKKDNDDLIILSKSIEKNTLVKAIFKEETVSIEIPFTDEASIENAIHCWALMLCLGYKHEIIQERISRLNPIAMRLEFKEGINNCSIINDSYNSDFKSLAIALDFMNQQSKHIKKTIILSDILQSGLNENDLYEDVAKLLEAKGIQKLIGIGPAISRQCKQFECDKSFFNTTEEFIQSFPVSQIRNQTILLKGARIFEFEQIDKFLQKKSHETVLEIHLNNLVNNLNTYRSIIKPSTKIMAMVKAFSYGCGSFEIANILQYHNIDYLTVAYVDEGVDLRKAGISTPIMVMNPDPLGFENIIKYQLEPEIYNFRTLSLLEKSIEQANLPSNKAVKIHIKIDTGMHRLGFLAEEVPELIKRLERNDMIYIQSIFSHLAASEDKEMDSFTFSQIKTFETITNSIQDRFKHPILRHILNSAGISRFPGYHFDMVRLGVGLYGIVPEEGIKGKLKAISCLKTTISQIKVLKAGETVGYNRKGKINTTTPIAILPIGYADGINRQLGNGNFHVSINGIKAPTIGNICMDMMMVDLTGIDAKEGDKVKIFNKEISLEEMAEKQNTIPYEILTGISRRVKRVYFYE